MKLSASWIQRVFAGFPCGMPGMGLEIEGAMQHAPQSVRHSIKRPRGKINGNGASGSAAGI
ncbi:MULTISPECIES: hypothetical protein [unclassified Erwinia]|uniref:hypothetical protein n=1 Tax=unclassified Erwinia TaxID=2622719 RepID=UPI001E4751A0|nr:hypothetical protein [Erwinia sp. ErVv1]